MVRIGRKGTPSLFFFDLQNLLFSTFIELNKVSLYSSCPHLKSNQSIRHNFQQLLSLLFKHATTYNATLQLHSHIITSGLVPTTHYLLFSTLLRFYPLYNNSLNQTPYLPPSFDTFLYSFLLHSCADLCSVVSGVQLHALTTKVGFQSNVYIQTALVRMYASSGFSLEACRVFDGMPERNSITWNVLITGLIKWGELETARSLFDQMPSRTVVSWTAIIDGYTRVNQHEEAMALFQRMVFHGNIEPSEITLLTIFPAISNLGALKICKSVHAYIEKRGLFVSDMRVSNSLIDSYAKCGCIESAVRFFAEIPSDKKNLVSWTSIISGLAMHGMGKEAMENFRTMEKIGIEPNQVTFLSVLSACSHGGLVEEGLEIFNNMVGEHEIAPDIKHYGCLIDILGRAGRLEEAEKMALEIPLEIVNVIIWRTLLGACSFHGNVEMGERVTRRILEMEGRYGGDYVLMSNIFAGVGRYRDAEQLRRLMDYRNASKVPGHSLV